MTYAPPKLIELGRYWVSQGGVNLGIVGDTAHQAKGVSYHLGKDQLASNAYSIQTARDKAGLSNAASAIDLGRLDDSLTEMYAFMRWFAQQCFDRKAAYRDVREVIFWSTTRNRVIGWSALAPNEWINDYGDLSHKTHGHISYFRDSEYRDKVAMFKAYPKFAAVPVPPGGDDMPDPSQYLPGYSATIKATSNVRESPATTGKLIRNITAPETWTDILGFVKGGADSDGACNTDQWLTRWHNGKWEYTSKCNITSGPTAPAAGPGTPIPPSAISCKPFTDPLVAQLATAELTGAQKEWDRQAAGATVQVKLLDRPK